MKVLYICHRIPYPPDKGDKIRSFHQVEELSRRHSVHLACLVDAKEDWPHVQTLRDRCASVDVAYRDRLGSLVRAGTALLTGKSLSVAAFQSGSLRKAIEERLERDPPDAILVFSSSMAPYATSTVPKILDLVDVDSEKWRMYADSLPPPLSWVFRLEADRLSREEARFSSRFHRTVLISEREAALFRERGGNGVVEVIPNGVDLHYFTPRAGRQAGEAEANVVFVGVMDYYPNIDAAYFFCNSILPAIHKTLPEARLYLVGRNPTRRVLALGKRPGVVVTGTVPDVRPYLARATVAVAPFRIARGIQNKVLEAMAAGVPVVGTSSGFQGIPVGAEDGATVEDDPRGFAEEVVRLVRDRELWTRRAGQARRYVERSHRWEEHGERLHALLEEIVAAPAETRPGRA